jgi:hypothetical protein
MIRKDDGKPSLLIKGIELDSFNSEPLDHSYFDMSAFDEVFNGFAPCRCTMHLLPDEILLFQAKNNAFLALQSSTNVEQIFLSYIYLRAVNILISHFIATAVNVILSFPVIQYRMVLKVFCTR